MDNPNELEDTFPVKVDSVLVEYLQKIIIWGVKLLAILMTIVILWGIVDVAIEVYSQAATPPYLLLNPDYVLKLLGGFLVVLIAIEIFLNIILYLRKDMSHLKLVIATALMAAARKVIILDYDRINPEVMYPTAGIIFALAVAYWLVKKPRSEKA